MQGYSGKHGSSLGGTNLAAWHAEVEQQATRAWDSTTLLAGARRLRRQLPAGQVCLLTRNAFGTAIAAATIASAGMRARDLTWREILLGRARDLPAEATMVFVEASVLGEGMKDEIRERFPGVEIIDDLVAAPAAVTDAA